MAPAGWAAAVDDVRIEFRSRPPAYPEFAGANRGLTGGRYPSNPPVAVSQGESRCSAIHKFKANCNCKESAGRRRYDCGSVAEFRVPRQQRNKGECGVVEILGLGFPGANLRQQMACLRSAWNAIL